MMPTIDLDKMIIQERKYVKTHTRYIPPEGYVTSEEFRKVSSARIDNICKQYGIL